MTRFYSRKHWIVYTITIVLVLIMGICIGKIFAMGKMPLVQAKAQVAENLDIMNELKMTVKGLEANVKEMQNKLDGQVSTIGYMKGDISKVSSEIKSGRDTINTTQNDSKLMERIITIQKESLTEQIGIWKALFRWLIILIITPLLSLNAWTVKNLFRVMSDAKYFQAQTAAHVEPEVFDDILVKKKAHDDDKSIVSKVVKTIKTVTGNKEA